MIPKYIFDFLMRWEGGATFTSDPLDNGGDTKYGISKRANPDLDIASLTEYQAKDIYFKRYWVPSHCNELEAYMQLLVFNCAVNCGVTTAVRILQKTVKASADGKFGKGTIAKVASYQYSPRLFAINYTSYLLIYYLKIIMRKRSQAKWVRGWFRRAIDAVWVSATNLPKGK